VSQFTSFFYLFLGQRIGILPQKPSFSAKKRHFLFFGTILAMNRVTKTINNKEEL
jgi:hypothetical protein